MPKKSLHNSTDISSSDSHADIYRTVEEKKLFIPGDVDSTSGSIHSFDRILRTRTVDSSSNATFVVNVGNEKRLDLMKELNRQLKK